MASGVWIVVPVYNEEGTLPGVVRELFAQGQGYNVVVVDDGSQREVDPNTISPAYLVRHCVNLGQGAALQTGIDFALQQGATQIVTFDSDGQHSAADIPQLLQALHKGADVALGSRFLEGGSAENISQAKLFTLKLATWFTRWSTGLELTDTHNGLRALSRSAAQRLRLTQNRMAHASQILAEIASLKLTYVEVPVHVRYTEYSVRKGQKISNAFNILWDSFAELLGR